ncbi:hypothetical protein [Granulicoccus sp. GXG6511]|uniref:hypothetical protein n=1 Tax=Granulicoccus sp. GXG6511 TaxID=3381351 RepID=UPI003D7DA467
MTRTTVGLGLTGLAGLLALIVWLSDRPDWWGGPVIFGVLVVLYWSLTSLLFDSSAS